MLTEIQKQSLADAAASGTKIWSIAYNPSTTEGDPIANALGESVFSFFRLDSSQLNQAILTSTDLT